MEFVDLNYEKSFNDLIDKCKKLKIKPEPPERRQKRINKFITPDSTPCIKCKSSEIVF